MSVIKQVWFGTAVTTAYDKSNTNEKMLSKRFRIDMPGDVIQKGNEVGYNNFILDLVMAYLNDELASDINIPLACVPFD